MISYKKDILDNGLTLIVMKDKSTPLVSVNTLFGVGSRDESPSLTGIAHLFEHLMFGGTKAVPDYDRVVTMMGGESNANTCLDFTQYYLTVPAGCLEQALQLEADRMHGLDLSQRSLQVQQSVVTEEYNYRFINQPYGDAWLLLRPLCYKVHPYRWCTIGADIRHVQEATLDDVQAFFERHYCPDNAIVAVVGNVLYEEVRRLADKLFGDLHFTGRKRSELPQEPEQKEGRSLTVHRDVPSTAIYMAYHMCGRLDDSFRCADLISDILSNGRSTRLYNELVKNRGLFTEIEAYVTGDRDPGLFLVSGRLREGVNPDEAKAAVEEELYRVAKEPLGDGELEKVLNKFESTFAFSQYKAIDCAMSLCHYEWLGKLEWVNNEPQYYRRTTEEEVRRAAA